MAENVISKEEAISLLQAEIRSLKADRRKAYSLTQYENFDARIARLQAVATLLEADETPAEETTESE